MSRSLLEHMRIDQDSWPRSTNRLLQERSGYVPSIEKIVNRTFNELDKNFIKEKGYQWIDLEGPWIGSGCRVHIYRRSLKNIPASTLGGAELGAASVDSEGRIQNVEIAYYISENRDIDDAKFKNVLHHELTHVYEFLQRSKRMQALEPDSQAFRKVEDSSIRNNVLGQLMNDIPNREKFQRTLLQRLGGCLYMCSPLEQNAFIAQIKSELEPRAGELSDFRKASEIVEQTFAWRNLVQAKRNLDWMKTAVHRKENQALVVKWCNAFFGPSVKTFNKSLKWISYELDKFERNLKNRLGKVCGELYQNSEESLKEQNRVFQDPMFLGDSLDWDNNLEEN